MVTEEDIQRTLESLCTVPAIDEALRLLRQKLPPELKYHSFAHTEEVHRDVILFALHDGLSPRQIELLAVAAVMHDAGFIQSRAKNEPIGAKYARGVMLRVGTYSPPEIKLVEQMILDTALVHEDGFLRQIPHTELSKYLLDADLGNLGREDFFDKSELQRQELGEEPTSFRIKTLSLLRGHTWLTEAARTLRQTRKDINLARLTELVERELQSE